MYSFHQSLVGSTALLLLLIAGCGEQGPKRYEVTGIVTFNGQPVPAGVIMFDPDTAKGNEGPQGFAHIHEGQYDTSEAEMSPVGGPHIVRITGYDGKSAPELPYGRPLFDEHIQAVDLPKQRTSVDFNLPVTDK